MTTEGNNGGPLSGQHEGYQGGRRGRLCQRNFLDHWIFSATRPPVALNIYVLL